MDLEILKQAGLTNNESLVYKSLLNLGPSLAGQVSRKTGLHRRTVYDVTEMLIQKGLIGYILKNNRRIFSASTPKRFLEILDQKKESINSILPEMMGIYGKTHDKQETNFYKGKDGLKTVFENQIKSGTKEILILGASPISEKVLPFYFKWYNEKRKERKIKCRIIFNEKTKIKIPLSEIKCLNEKNPSPMSINIYRDKVAIILWSEESPLVIVIKNKDISQGYKSYFELMWKIAKK